MKDGFVEGAKVALLQLRHSDDANAGQKSKTADNQPGKSTKSSTIMDFDHTNIKTNQ